MNGTPVSAVSAVIPTSHEETEIARLQHALMKVLPKVFAHDSPWMTSTARLLAVELWRDNVRTMDAAA